MKAKTNRKKTQQNKQANKEIYIIVSMSKY